MTHTYKPQSGQTMLLTLLFSVCALGGVVAAGSGYFQYELLNMSIRGNEISEQQWLVNDLRQLGVSLAQLVLFLVTTVMFCIWVHQANINARALGAAEMKSTPGWAVGSFFVPIVNIAAPYLAMVELWKVSDPSGAVCSGIDHPKQRVSPLLGAWWLTWLLGAGIGSVAHMMVRGAANQTAAARATSVEILAAIVWMTCCMLVAFVVRDITWRQARRHEAQRLSGITPSAHTTESSTAERSFMPLMAGACAAPDSTAKPILPNKKSA